MLAIHDQLTRQMRNRLKTINMGLGLVRLLQDAGRIEEARMVRSSLENSFQGIEGDKPMPKPFKANRLKCVSRSSSFQVMRARHELAHITN